jgi:hypothetical protein
VSTEYLYRPTISLVEPFGNCIARHRIVKRTAKRVVYLRVGELIDYSGEPLHPNLVPNGKTRFVDRQILEDHGYARPANSGLRLFLSFDRCLAASRQREATYGSPRGGPAPDLAALKAAMIAAHPDKGGTSAAFIEAQRRYVAAKRGFGTRLGGASAT